MKSMTTPERDVGSSESSAWVRTADQLPPNKVEVETKIDDSTGGVRNVQTLKRGGNLWFYPDMSMYVYYHPTHWRSLPNVTAEERTALLRQSKTAAKAADIAHETKTEGRTLRPFRVNPHE